MESEFLCPECGSGNAEVEMMVSPMPPDFSDNADTDPWRGVLQIITCGDCGRDVPAHLAERWNGLTVDEARRDWLAVYRDSRPGSG